MNRIIDAGLGSQRSVAIVDLTSEEQIPALARTKLEPLGISVFEYDDGVEAVSALAVFLDSAGSIDAPELWRAIDSVADNQPIFLFVAKSSGDLVARLFGVLHDAGVRLLDISLSGTPSAYCLLCQRSVRYSGSLLEHLNAMALQNLIQRQVRIANQKILEGLHRFIEGEVDITEISRLSLGNHIRGMLVRQFPIHATEIKSQVDFMDRRLTRFAKELRERSLAALENHKMATAKLRITAWRNARMQRKGEAELNSVNKHNGQGVPRQSGRDSVSVDLSNVVRLSLSRRRRFLPVKSWKTYFHPVLVRGIKFLTIQGKLSLPEGEFLREDDLQWRITFLDRSGQTVPTPYPGCNTTRAGKSFLYCTPISDAAFRDEIEIPASAEKVSLSLLQKGGRDRGRFELDGGCVVSFYPGNTVIPVGDREFGVVVGPYGNDLLIPESSSAREDWKIQAENVGKATQSLEVVELSASGDEITETRFEIIVSRGKRTFYLPGPAYAPGGFRFRNSATEGRALRIVARGLSPADDHDLNECLLNSRAVSPERLLRRTGRASWFVGDEIHKSVVLTERDQATWRVFDAKGPSLHIHLPLYYSATKINDRAALLLLRAFDENGKPLVLPGAKIHRSEVWGQYRYMSLKPEQNEFRCTVTMPCKARTMCVGVVLRDESGKIKLHDGSFAAQGQERIAYTHLGSWGGLCEGVGTGPVRIRYKDDISHSCSPMQWGYLLSLPSIDRMVIDLDEDWDNSVWRGSFDFCGHPNARQYVRMVREAKKQGGTIQIIVTRLERLRIVPYTHWPMVDIVTITDRWLTEEDVWKLIPSEFKGAVEIFPELKRTG